MTVKKLMLWFGIFGSIASIASLLFIFIPADEKIKLLVNTQSVERLTQNFEKKEPNLKVNYQFKGLEIKNLWKYNIQFQNKSKKTIIGNGNQKNILTDNLSLILKEGYDILDSKELKSDFNNKLKIDSTDVKIYFEQWRENEILEYSFYVKTDINEPDSLLLKNPEFRQIIDGDILFNLQDNNIEKNKITRVFPEKVRQASFVLILIFLGLFVLISIFLIVFIPLAFIKVKNWKNNNWKKYKSVVEEVFFDDIEKKDKLLEDPNYAPEFFWEKFEGNRYPSISADMDKFYQPILAVTIISVFGIAFFITFMELVYIF
jgi:hypothetical protein